MAMYDEPIDGLGFVSAFCMRFISASCRQVVLCDGCRPCGWPELAAVASGGQLRHALLQAGHGHHVRQPGQRAAEPGRDHGCAGNLVHAVQPGGHACARRHGYVHTWEL